MPCHRSYVLCLGLHTEKAEFEVIWGSVFHIGFSGEGKLGLGLLVLAVTSVICAHCAICQLRFFLLFKKNLYGSASLPHHILKHLSEHLPEHIYKHITFGLTLSTKFC